ncbi:MAG: YdcF family protein [bacterium]
MFLKKLISSFINIFGISLIMMVIFAPRKFKNFSFLLAIFLYFLATDFGSSKLAYLIEKNYLNQYFFYHSLTTNPKDIIILYKDIDYIVILSGGVNNNGELKEGSLQRTITALLVYKNIKKFYNKSPEIIILGGNIDKKNPTSIEIKKLIENLEINPKITYETESLDTFQNIKKLKEIKSKTNSKILIVTSAYHIPRVKVAIENTFNKNFLQNNILFLPCNFMYKYNYNWYDFLLSSEAIQKTNTIISEMIGIAYYKIYYKIKIS